jgi:hypothetical protein
VHTKLPLALMALDFKFDRENLPCPQAAAVPCPPLPSVPGPPAGRPGAALT